MLLSAAGSDAGAFLLLIVWSNVWSLPDAVSCCVLTCALCIITTGIQLQQQDAEPAESLSARSSGTETAAAAAAPDSSSRAKQLQQSHEKQKEGKGGLSGSFVRALAGLSVGSFSNAVTSCISSMLNTQVNVCLANAGCICTWLPLSSSVFLTMLCLCLHWDPLMKAHSSWCVSAIVLHPQAPGAAFSTTIKKTAHTTLSTDGWTLHLVHCYDTSLQPGQRKAHPILMCPGLASSGPGTFDLLPNVGITLHTDKVHSASIQGTQQHPNTCCIMLQSELSCLQLPFTSRCSLRLSRLKTLM
jgi:hypothetical protein